MFRRVRVNQPFGVRCLSVGDTLPSVPFHHNSPANEVTIPKTGKQVLVGIPAAFSPGCSNTHVPGYIARMKEFKDLGVERIYVISVNDAFVMSAYEKSFDLGSTADFVFLSDRNGEWTERADLGFDASRILGKLRCKRFAAFVEGGRVQAIHVEADGTGITGSAADK